MTITKERLEEIKARAEAATPGPWGHVRAGAVHVLGADGEPAPRTGMHAAGSTFPRVVGGADYGGTFDFIAHARTDIPDLVAEVKRLRGLMKYAEWYGSPSLDSCPWCDSIREQSHGQTCLAFTPDGEVK